MKRIILSIALALCVGGAFGQTAEKLMAKWKKVQGAEYEDKTKSWYDDFTAGLKSNNELTAEDIALIRKNFKKSEQVQFVLDDEQREELERDIQSLKGYEMLVAISENNEPNDSANMFRQMLESFFSINYKVAVYGKVKGDIVSDYIIRLDAFDKVALGHIVCKMRKDLLAKTIFIQSTNDDGDDEESPAISVSKVTEDVENGNVLFVIHGEEHPELHSIEEVKNYMITNNIHWNQEAWVFGQVVKEKYPHTDRKVVIEFTEREKDAE